MLVDLLNRYNHTSAKIKLTIYKVNVNKCMLKFVLDITENFMNTEQKYCQNNSLNFNLSS